MLRVAPRPFAATGVKVTLMVQLAPAARLAGQVLVWAKSPALVPVTLTPLMFSAAVPLLVSVTVCAALVVFTVWSEKVSVVGLSVTAGRGSGAAPAPTGPLAVLA